MRTKRFLSGFLLLVGFVGAHAEQRGDFESTRNRMSVAIPAYTGRGVARITPGMISELPVSGIRVVAFADCARLTTITIPDWTHAT